jgi:PAS domain S-box-containing protein
MRAARWHQTVLAAAVVVLAVAAIATLLVQAHTLTVHIEALRAARSDNRTWLVSQLEVDVARLESALLETAADPAHAADARLRLDILVSRVTLLDAQSLNLQGTEPEGTSVAGIAALEAVRTETGRLTATMDAWPGAPDEKDVSGALTILRGMAPDVRALSLAVLAHAVSTERANRDAIRAVLGKFLSLAILLVLLLTAVIVVVGDLYRDLLRRSQAARQIGSNLERTIEASHDAVVVCDAAGRIRSFNAAAERMFGIGREDAIGTDAATLLLAPGTATGIDAFAPPMAPGAAGSLVTGRHASGRTFPMEVSRVADTDGEGRAMHLVILRDVSDRVAAEQGLRAARDAALQSAEMRSRFLGVMAHEMRTPLNGVIAALDLMGGGPLTAPQRRLHGLASTAAQTALRQIDDLLDLHRQDAVAELPTPFDPCEALRDAVEVARAPAAQRGNRLTLRLPEVPVGRVLGARRAFARAISNLVSNAVKYTRDGLVTVTLAATPPDAEGGIILTVSVRDTGPGIAPEDQARIFEDFETVDRTLAGGSGLGLGIARRAVRAMGGELTLDSAPGKGSEFRFTARVTAAAAPAVANVPAAPPLFILVAEDNPINSHLMCEMLHRLGHTTVLAADGHAAVAEAQRTAFDALVFDVAMPCLDGIAAIERIRAVPGPSQRTPALVVSAQLAPSLAARVATLPAAAILAKPLRLDALERALARLVQPPDDPLLDRAVIEDARAVLGGEAQARLFARFAADLQADIDRGDVPDAALHRAAGAAAILGARRLHRLLAEAGAGHRDDAAIRTALAATRAAMAAEGARAAAAAE